MSPFLELSGTTFLDVDSAGLFMSRGFGIHPDRVIDSFEIILVRKGVLAIQEEDDLFNVAAGQTLLLWPDRRHRGTAPYKKDLSFYWLHFSPVPPTLDGPASHLIRIPRYRAMARTEALVGLFHVFMNEFTSGHYNPLKVSLLTMLILCEIAAAPHVCFPRGEADFALAERIHTYLLTHFSRPISARHVAAALGYNKDYLGRVYHRIHGVSMTTRLNQLRVDEAKMILIETTLPVSHIATRCGFRDPVYLRRVFYEHTGMPPREFRRLYSQVSVNTR